MELLNEKERRVMEALYTLGQSPISEVAKETLLNRTALYHTVNNLKQKGLVTQIEKNKISYFEAISAESYSAWAEKRVGELNNEMKSDVARFKNINKVDKPTLYADVKYFEGAEAVKALYYDSIRDNKDKLIYDMLDYEKGYDTFHDFFEYEYLKDRVVKGIRVKSILPDSPFNRKYTKVAKKMLREMSFVNMFQGFGIEINIYGEKLAVVALDKKHPAGVIIKNKIITKAFKEIFEYIWESGKKYNVKS